MAFSFSIYIYPGTDLKKSFERLKEEAARSPIDITISGTPNSGSVSGDIVGSYRVKGDEMHFSISKKPALASEDMVKDALKRFF